MDCLYVLYDETCGFCCRCAEWLSTQPTYVPLHCLPAGSDAALRAFPTLDRSGKKQELTAIDERGGVYREADAWLVVLWALRNFRPWCTRLSSPALKPLARSAFEFISEHRHQFSRWLSLRPEGDVGQMLVDFYGDPTAPRCGPDGCELPRRPAEGRLRFAAASAAE